MIKISLLKKYSNSIILSLLNSKFLIVLLFINSLSFCQETRPASSESRSSSVYINYSNSIFNTPIEQYKYIKTHRGVEIYETYKHPANGYLNQTIFPKAMPVAVIKTNSVTRNLVIYKNYSNSIFNKPIEAITIKPFMQTQKRINTSASYKNLPKYEGHGEISYGE